MKYLGIDYGAKRIGIAITDDSGSMAFAKKVLPASPDLVLEIKKICDEEKIEGIVMGESKNFLGVDNPIMKQIYIFKSDLESFVKLPVYFEPELMTSMEAQHIQGDNDMNDASAAAIILNSFLSKKTNNVIADGDE